MDNKTITSLPDIPLSQSANDFGTDSYVNGLIQFIQHSATPITIALQGEWGSGKTSLMNRLYNELCSEKGNFIGININTWEHSMLSSPEETVVKIIGRLVQELSHDDPEPQKKLKSYLSNVGNMALRGLREGAKITHPAAALLVELLGVPSEMPKKNGEEEPKPTTLADLKRALTDAVSRSIGTSKQGVIIFVDDLDRLNPPLAVQILELLKNIFTLDNCIFVLAIDYEVVVKGLEPKFGKFSESNEREFRSFFDKIIQVPFSLPVSNYKPLDFVLDSLENIGYLSPTQKKLTPIRNSIERIVVASVGKNPRSIKRLINTLSLLNCIAKQPDASQEASLEEKIINLAVVALQVCYPKVYGLLTLNPNFRTWNDDLAQRVSLPFNSESDVVDAEFILDKLCAKDNFMGKHRADIIDLLTIIDGYIGNRDDLEATMRKILDHSSVTGVSAETEAEELDKRTLMQRLHENILHYVTAQEPDLPIRPKPISGSGNGGFLFSYPNGDKSTFDLRPNQQGSKVALQVWIKFGEPRPKRLVGMDFDAFYHDEEVQRLLSPLEAAVNKLCSLGIMKGTYRPKDDIVFRSFTEELRYRGSHGWLDKVFSCHGDFTITLESAADYEDSSIVGAIGNLVIAAYQFNQSVKNINH